MCTSDIYQAYPAQEGHLAVVLHHFWLSELTTSSQDPQCQIITDMEVMFVLENCRWAAPDIDVIKFLTQVSAPGFWKGFNNKGWCRRDRMLKIWRCKFPG